MQHAEPTENEVKEPRKFVELLETIRSAIRCIGSRVAPGIGPLTVPILLITAALISASYILGMVHNPQPTLHQIHVKKTCATPTINVLYFNPDSFVSPPSRKISWRLTPWDFSIICNQIELSVAGSDLTPTIISRDYSDRDKNLNGADHEATLVNIEKHAPSKRYKAAIGAMEPGVQRINGNALTHLVFHPPAARWMSFSKKGMIFNFDVSGSDGTKESLQMTVTLPDGYRLDSATTPSPHLITLRGNSYTFLLTPQVMIDERKFLPSLKIVYESELFSALKEYLLLVLAAIFGFSIQLSVDRFRRLKGSVPPRSGPP